MLRDVGAGNLRPVHPGWTALRTLAVVVTGVSAFYAFSVLPLAQTYAILFAAPLLITVLAIPILGEKVRIRRWIAVLVGLAGVMVVLRPGGADLSLGHAAALLAALTGAFASVIVRKIGREERSEVLMLYPMLGNYICTGAALPFVYQPMQVAHLGLILVISVFGFVAGLCVIAAYRRAEAALVAPMQYSQILWAALYGAVFFDETPDGATLAGSALIIASGLYIVLRESRVSTTTPVIGTRGRLFAPTSPRPADSSDRAG
jgi:drug/metabolite transporter (DMT)-like permease